MQSEIICEHSDSWTVKKNFLKFNFKFYIAYDVFNISSLYSAESF